MLNSLTIYLLQYRKVTIPYIGSFELMHVPARLDFASRVIYPPSSEIVFTVNDDVNDHQLAYFQRVNKAQAKDVKNQLQNLGQQLKEHLLQQPFEWKGVGKLEGGSNGLVFHSTLQNKLEPVAAHKVIRENASHAVTVGDKEMQSHEASEMLETTPAKSYFMLIVWLIVLAALLFIVYLFYTKGFTPLTSGSQQQVGAIIGLPFRIG